MESNFDSGNLILIERLMEVRQRFIPDLRPDFLFRERVDFDKKRSDDGPVPVPSFQIDLTGGRKENGRYGVNDEIGRFRLYQRADVQKHQHETFFRPLASLPFQIQSLGVKILNVETRSAVDKEMRRKPPLFIYFAEVLFCFQERKSRGRFSHFSLQPTVDRFGNIVFSLVQDDTENIAARGGDFFLGNLNHRPTCLFRLNDQDNPIH